MAYHVLADIYPSRLTEQELVQLTNDEVAGTTIVEATYEDCRADAEAEIDGYLGARYALPLTETPALVARLSITLTIYQLYRRRMAGGVPEQIRDDYTDGVKLLRSLSDGTVTLGVQPAAGVNTERSAKLQSHTGRFSRDALKDF